MAKTKRGSRFLWQIAPLADRSLFADLAPVHPAVIQVLSGRGYSDAAAIQNFLSNSSMELHRSQLLPDMAVAVDRLTVARDRGERIGVYADYDADGVTAAAVLYRGLRQFSIDPIVQLPNRFRDGYGLHPDGVKSLVEQGATVIVTADCGITAYEAVACARELGVDVIITDHHHPSTDLPAAHAIVNPHRSDAVYPFPDLCGAGVAYKLIDALDRCWNGDGSRAAELLDLVAIATVADVMPLRGENRALVRAGLQRLNNAPSPGIRALLNAANVETGKVTAETIGFQLGPRLNAAGRLDDPRFAYDLLIAEDLSLACEHAERLEVLNRKRQALAQDLTATARGDAAAQLNAGAVSVCVGGPDWPRGVIGLVAGRLCQELGVPVLVYSTQDSICTGSGRSPRTVNLYLALEACAQHLVKFGGHAQAAGFTLAESNVDALRMSFDQAVRNQTGDQRPDAVLSLDGALPCSRIDPSLLDALEQLAPFGHGFERPTFYSHDLVLLESRPVGSDRSHWRIRVRARQDAASTHSLTGIGFGLGRLAGKFPVGSSVQLAYEVRWNDYVRPNGVRQHGVELQVLDVAEG